MTNPLTSQPPPPIQRNRIKELKFYQLNLHKSALTTAHLFSVATNGPSIFMLTEVSYKRNHTLANIPRQYRQFSGGPNPRAAIVLSTGIEAWLMPEYSNSDMTTITVKGVQKDTVFCSLYCDINHDIANNTQLKELELKCRQQMHMRVIICADTNSHSDLWGEETNARGVKFEDFLAPSRLVIENIGNAPTFEVPGRNCKTAIDVTFSTMSITDDIHSWRISDKESLSDHKLIEFSLSFEIEKPPPRRNFKKIDWELFKKDMDMLSSQWVEPTQWDAHTLDKEAKNMNSDINKILDKYCPKTPVNVNKKQHPLWWDEELEKLKRAHRKATNNYFRQGRTPELKATKQQLRNAYRNAMLNKRDISFKDFCDGIKSVKDLSNLNKAMSNTENSQLGLLLDGDKYTTTPEETLKLLMKTHFPGSTEVDPKKEAPTKTVTKADLKELDKIITKYRVQQTIKGFSALKSAGPDDHPPAVLKALGNKALNRLIKIYKATVLVAYTPLIWRESKVIFIPKPGKAAYNTPKAFRPISLMPFIFKTLEKTIATHINDAALTANPLDDSQFGFVKGVSTENALSKVLDKIESAYHQGQYAVALFLDISGAFDNIKTDSIVRAFVKRGIEPSICKWYTQYLENRIAHGVVKNCKVTHYVDKGVPQGGTLSTHGWAIPADDALKAVRALQIAVEVIGFADDMNAIATGPEPIALISLIQQALNTLVEWADSCGLKFSTEKTAPMIFSRRKTTGFPKIKLYGKEIDYVNETKYLGLTIDSNLTWNQHIKQKIANTKRSLNMMKSCVGRLWGLTPKLLDIGYKTIVKPGITYGSLCWGPTVLQRKDPLKQFNSISRLLVTSMGAFRSHAPTAGLEMIFNIMPMDLCIQSEGAKSFMRTETHKYVTWNGLSNIRGTQKGHRLYWSKFLEPTPIRKHNVIRTKVQAINKNYLLHIEEPIDEKPNDISIFVAGSNSKGAYHIQRANNSKKNVVFTGESSSNQAELMAIDSALASISDSTDLFDTTTIIPRSATTFNQLKETKTQNKLILKITNRIMTFPNKVVFKKNSSNMIKRFNNVRKLLKRKTVPEGPYPHSLLEKKEVTHHIDNLVQAKWDKRWKNSSEYRQTKHWFPERDPEISKQILLMSRPIVSDLVNFITGHGFLNRHQNLLYPHLHMTSLCRLCEEGEETPLHLMTECPVPQIVSHRTNLFKSAVEVNRRTGNLVTTFFLGWSPTELVRLLHVFQAEFDLP
jgi:hypothetical protein